MDQPTYQLKGSYTLAFILSGLAIKEFQSMVTASNKPNSKSMSHLPIMTNQPTKKQSIRNQTDRLSLLQWRYTYTLYLWSNWVTFLHIMADLKQISYLLPKLESARRKILKIQFEKFSKFKSWTPPCTTDNIFVF